MAQVEYGIIREEGVLVYEGEVHSGVASGYGVETILLSGQTCSGMYVNGEANGYCVNQYVDGTTVCAFFSNDNVCGHAEMRIKASGEVFMGQMKEGKRNGLGHNTWPASGDGYRGQFVDSMFHGYGERVYRDGSRYIGQFVKGKKHGYGQQHSANGMVAHGQFANEQYHGPVRVMVGGSLLNDVCYKNGAPMMSFNAVDVSAVMPLVDKGAYDPLAVVAALLFTIPAVAAAKRVLEETEVEVAKAKEGVHA